MVDPVVPIVIEVRREKKEETQLLPSLLKLDFSLGWSTWACGSLVIATVPQRPNAAPRATEVPEDQAGAVWHLSTHSQGTS